MFTSLRSTLTAMLAFAASVALVSGPALARDSYVSDGASLFSASTVSSLNSEIATFNGQTGKEVVVVTVPSLDGSTISDVAEKTFAEKQVNGVLILLSKAEKKDIVVGDRASHVFFPQGSFEAIRGAMTGYFRSGDYDGGITNGVSLVLNGYRSHEGSLRTNAQHAYAPVSQSSNNAGFSGGGMSLFWLLLVLVAGFLIIRAIFRAISGPRVMPPGYGGPGPGMPYGGGPGYGGYGMGGGMGGGGFFSGLLGGLGGAFIGNELFGRHDGGGYVDQSGIAGGGYDNGGNLGDSAGWQSDAGQADMGGASFGGFGDSGGGFGGGDFGGGGDSGGGGW